MTILASYRRKKRLSPVRIKMANKKEFREGSLGTELCGYRYEHGKYVSFGEAETVRTILPCYLPVWASRQL